MSGRGNGAHDPGSNIASLEEARRRAAEKAKAEKRAARSGRSRSLRDLVIGGTIVAMAVGFLVSLVVPLVKG